MGRCRSLSKNLAKYQIKMKKKSIEKTKRERRIKNERKMDMNSVEICATDAVEEMSSKGDAISSNSPKKRKTLFRADKLRRNALPLMISIKCSKQAKTGSMIAAKKLSKKKARKVMKTTRRKEANARKVALKMEVDQSNC